MSEELFASRLNRSSFASTSPLRLGNFIPAEFADAYTDMFYRFYLGNQVSVLASGFICLLKEKYIKTRFKIICLTGILCTKIREKGWPHIVNIMLFKLMPSCVRRIDVIGLTLLENRCWDDLISRLKAQSILVVWKNNNF